MWELQLVDLFRYYLPAIIFALICGVLVLHFRRTKEKGYLAITIGFILLTVGWLALPTLTLYSVRALDLLGTTYSIWPWIGWYISYTAFYLVPALLILIGFIYIYKGSKKASNKLTPRVADDPTL